MADWLAYSLTKHTASGTMARSRAFSSALVFYTQMKDSRQDGLEAQFWARLGEPFKSQKSEGAPAKLRSCAQSLELR